MPAGLFRLRSTSAFRTAPFTAVPSRRRPYQLATVTASVWPARVARPRSTHRADVVLGQDQVGRLPGHPSIAAGRIVRTGGRRTLLRRAHRRAVTFQRPLPTPGLQSGAQSLMRWSSFLHRSGRRSWTLWRPFLIGMGHADRGYGCWRDSTTVAKRRCLWE